MQEEHVEEGFGVEFWAMCAFAFVAAFSTTLLILRSL